MKKIKVRLLKSTNTIKRSHRATVRGLGLKRIDQVVELIDTPAVRGMINKVNYLVRIDQQD
jgi:large subunit ribosomal protein L30